MRAEASRPTLSETVSSILLNPGRPRTRIHPDVREILTRHLHSIDSLTDTFLSWNETGTWKTNSETEKMLGGTRSTTLQFLQNRHTWADLTHLPSNQAKNIMKTAITAAGKSTRGMRTVIIRQDQNPIPGNSIPELPPMTGEVRVMDGLVVLRQGTATNTTFNPLSSMRHNKTSPNTANWIVSLVENKLAMPFHFGPLIADLTSNRHTGTIDQYNKPKWCPNLVPEQLPRHHKQYTKIDRTIVWTRRNYHRPAADSHGPNPGYLNMEKSSPLAGAIGILPKGLRHDLIRTGHPYQTVDTDTLKKVSKIINNTARKAYLTYENWRKRKKRA